jgi:signal transduction histidine kinase
MHKIKSQISHLGFTEYGLPLVILAVLLLFTYAKFFEHPYQGFRLDSNDRVLRIYIEQPTEPKLQEGDQLIQVGTTSWIDFQDDLRKPFFQEVQPGNVVPLLVERAGQKITVHWQFPGPNQKELTDLLENEGWLAFIFWLAGTLTALVLRPKDERWLLMIAFNYLTAIWIVTGSGLSFYHIWNAAIILRMDIWISVPVYLHLHWVYPKPFKKLPGPAIWSVYFIAVGLAAAEWFQLLPRSLYFLGFLIGAGGSVLLLIAHAILQPAARRDLRLMLIAVLLSMVPAILLGLFGAFDAMPLQLAGAGTIGLPFLPLTYFYASYRHQLGKSELRVNRLISVYLFLILLGLVLLPLIVLANSWVTWNGAGIFIGIIATFFTAVASILGFPRFQTFVEKRLLGVRLAPAQLPEIYAARITTSTSSLSLQNLIRDDILPSLLVRQFVFLQFDEHGDSKTLFVTGVSEEQSPCKADIPELIATAGKYRPLAVLNDAQPCPWVRLALPLKVEDKLIGLWLFGRRDPDDTYSQMEIPTLQSLANQTAIAQSNILQTERIKALYLANIDRHEEERLSLALELHDSVLNQIAVLTISLDAPMPPSFQENYEKLTHQVREIIGNLRPPMLNYGLRLAIDELAEDLMERTQDTFSITMDIQTDDGRYPQNIEQHLFRIVQEACENAIRHAKAKNIHISGRLNPEEIDLKVEDDGVGFEVEKDLNLDRLLTNKHFGLTGMKERAELIDAQISIHSTPNAGTSVQVVWTPRSDNVDEYA